MYYLKLLLLACVFAHSLTCTSYHAKKGAIIFGTGLVTIAGADILGKAVRKKNTITLKENIAGVGTGLAGTALIWQVARAAGMGRVLSPERNLYRLAHLHNIVEQGFKYYPNPNNRLITYASFPVPTDNKNTHTTFSCAFANKKDLEYARRHIREARSLLPQIRREFGYRYESDNVAASKELEQHMQQLQHQLNNQLEEDTEDNNNK